MPDRDALQRYESSAERGIIEFAEAMQAIRDQNLYPGAEQVPDAWPSYCKARWGLSKSNVDTTILALPVIRRLTDGGAVRETPIAVTAAAAVATLAVPVQDAILAGSSMRDEVKAKAKAVRALVKRVELTENRTPTVDEQIAAAEEVKPAPKKRKSKRNSKFARALGDALHFAQVAADHIQTNPIDDVDNDWAWNRIEYLRHQIDRIAEKLYKPRHVRDLNDDFAELLGGSES